MPDSTILPINSTYSRSEHGRRIGKASNCACDGSLKASATLRSSSYKLNNGSGNHWTKFTAPPSPGSGRTIR